jgi:hypothetical protein
MIGFLSFGQDVELEEKTPSEKESKIRLSPFFSYDFILSPDAVYEDMTVIFFNYNQFNYKIGVDIEYKVSKMFSIGSGLSFSQKRFLTTTECEYCQPSYSEVKFDLGFLEIPLIGVYTYKISNFEVFGQLGIINLINYSSNIFDDDNGFSLNNINTYSISGKVGLGASYPVFGKHRLFLATDYSTGFTDVFENVDYKLKTLGIRMGVQFLL